MEKIIRIIILFLCINGIAKYQTLDLNTLRLAQKQVTRSAGAGAGIAKKGKNQDQFIIDRAVDPDT